MRLEKSWIIATRDMRIFLRKRYTAYSLVVFPVIIGVALPLVLRYVASKMGAARGTRTLEDIMNAFAFLFAIGASAIPTVLASYSLVGEKVEKSLEPLLAAPITDSELLLGKGIGAFIPSVASLYIGSAVFMLMSDLATHAALGYYYFPNWTIGLILLTLVPLTAVLAVEWSVIVSARASDPRAAQLQGYLITLPLAAIYVATEVAAIQLNPATIGAISGVILAADVVLFFMSTRAFRREEILTKWT
jgi:ABC-2 type transport system permease protein